MLIVNFTTAIPTIITILNLTNNEIYLSKLSLMKERKKITVRNFIQSSNDNHKYLLNQSNYVFNLFLRHFLVFLRYSSLD